MLKTKEEGSELYGLDINRDDKLVCDLFCSETQRKVSLTIK